MKLAELMGPNFDQPYQPGKLIPLKGVHFKSKANVPAGKAKTMSFPALGISLSIEKPTGDTSKAGR